MFLSTTRSRFIVLLISCLSLLSLGVLGQQIHPAPEFRGVWVATVNHIDWPSKPGLPTDKIKAEVVQLLNQQHQLGMNTVILQVRPAADAFYPSSIDPWSRYLTGEPGQAPEPYFDPLQFWIEECHRRDMELHAWLNPYRLAQYSSEPLASNHIAFKHPEWVVEYGGKLYFDPGVPAARDYLVHVVAELVGRYDVDAIHFDDYFYPYPTADPFPDNASFSLYNRAFFPEARADWRRENVDILIKMLNETIKEIKPWVKFGISPFGVWRNRSADPEGSATRAGVSNYDDLYADIRKWLREGWIDYVLPQLYWEIGHPAADFATLTEWWNQNAFGRSLYIGHSPYKVDRSTPNAAWGKPGELPKQIDFLRQFPNVSGSAFFSSRHFNRDLLGFQDSLIQRLYSLQALVPPMPWLQQGELPVPDKVTAKQSRLEWDPLETPFPGGKPQRYVVHLYPSKRAAELRDGLRMRFLAQDHWIEFTQRPGRRHTYWITVTVLDRLNNEGQPSRPVKVKL